MEKNNSRMSSKSAKSFLNAFFAFLKMFLVSVFGLIVTKLYLKAYGSDFNGLSSSASQFLSTIMLLEGGVTIASNVALFKPFEEKDYPTINSIMSATKKRFLKMSLILLVVGLVAAVVYSFFIGSNLNYWLILLYLLLTVMTAFLNICISMKYRVVLQTDQKEYIISIATMIPTVIGYFAIIVLVSKGLSPFFVPIVIFVYYFAEYLIIAIYTRKKYPFINYNVPPNYSLVKGSGDIFILKITSALFASFPIIFLSFFSTTLASIYAIYNMVFNVIRNAISVFSQAPRLSFGAIFSSKKQNDESIYSLFKLYQLIVTIVSFALLTVTCVLMIPFLKVYISGINDANYISEVYVPLFALIALVSSVHIPSGQIILMSGRFKISRTLQLIAAGILICLAPPLTIFFNITGLLVSVLISSLFLCVSETVYTFKYIFKKSLSFFIINIAINFISCLAIILVMRFSNFFVMNGYLSFFLIAALLTVVFSAFFLLVNMAFYKKDMQHVFSYIKSFIRGIVRR